MFHCAATFKNGLVGADQGRPQPVPRQASGILIVRNNNNNNNSLNRSIDWMRQLIEMCQSVQKNNGLQSRVGHQRTWPAERESLYFSATCGAHKGRWDRSQSAGHLWKSFTFLLGHIVKGQTHVYAFFMSPEPGAAHLELLFSAY